MHVLNSALEQRRLTSENAYLHQQLDERFGLGSMVGKSAPMRALFQLIETVAPTAATILITGETGTGKEMVARAIHQTSPRHRGRFVAINVSAIPETLLDAELFGHARGAFTGAVAMRQGRLEQADSGTLFLDEVGTMPMALQMKMLRVLQEREFERIGETRTISVDVRDRRRHQRGPAQDGEGGTFREDLYYRLNVDPVQLAPLRERPEDIPLLVPVQIRCGKYSQRRDRCQHHVSQEAMRRLMSFRLARATSVSSRTPIERALAMIGGRASRSNWPICRPTFRSRDEPAAKPDRSTCRQEGIDLPALIAQIEKDLIDRALARTEQNKGAAATIAGSEANDAGGETQAAVASRA